MGPTKQELEKITHANSFAELAPIALNIIKRVPKPIGQLCGPIGTGGLGSVEKNLEEFDRAIQYLKEHGMHMFDQMPFEEPMQRIKEETGQDGQRILDDFYALIFESREISVLYMLPNWESSMGANWEHEQGKQAGMNIVYMPEDWDERTDYIQHND